MQEFADSCDAVDYLVAQIVQQAQVEGVGLSEVERRMLYFSETDWTLPDIGQISEEFERGYNESEYELKIASLIRNLRERMKRDDPDTLQR